MYYLYCVNTIINNKEIAKISEYQNYELLNRDDLEELFKIILLFNPNIFVNA